MTNSILDALVLYAGAGVFFYRAWIHCDFFRYLPASMIFVFALTIWPFSAPMWVRLSMIYAVALIFFPFFKSKNLLKERRVVWSYLFLVLLAVTYAVICLWIRYSGLKQH